MEWVVVDIINGNTFKVTPNWEWREHSKDVVTAVGFVPPTKGKPGHKEAKEKLKRLVLDKKVELKNYFLVERGRLICDVWLFGKPLSDFFPEYK